MSVRHSFLFALIITLISACGGGDSATDTENDTPIDSTDNSTNELISPKAEFNVIKSINTETEINNLLIFSGLSIGISDSDIRIVNPEDKLIYTYKFVETADAITEYVSIIDEGNNLNTFHYRYHNGYLIGITYYTVLSYSNDIVDTLDEGGTEFTVPRTYWIPLPDEGLTKPVAARAKSSTKEDPPLNGHIRDDYAEDCDSETSFEREVSCDIIDTIYKSLDIISTPFLFPLDSGLFETLPGYLQNGLDNNLDKAKSFIQASGDKINELKSEINTSDLLETLNQKKVYIQTQQSIVTSQLRETTKELILYIQALKDDLTTIEIEQLDLNLIDNEFILDGDNPDKACALTDTKVNNCPIDNGIGYTTQSCINGRHFNYWGFKSACKLDTCDEDYKNEGGACLAINQNYEQELDDAREYDGLTCFTGDEDIYDLHVIKHVCVEPNINSGTGLDISYGQYYYTAQKSTSDYKVIQEVICPNGCELQAVTVIDNELADHIFRDYKRLRKNLANENGAYLNAYSTHTYNNSTSIHDGKRSIYSLQKTYLNGINTSYSYSQFINYSVNKYQDNEITENCETPDQYGYSEDFANSFVGYSWNEQLCNLIMPDPIELDQEIINYLDP